jgi:hypothetical protein
MLKRPRNAVSAAGAAIQRRLLRCGIASLLMTGKGLGCVKTRGNEG